MKYMRFMFRITEQKEQAAYGLLLATLFLQNAFFASEPWPEFDTALYVRNEPEVLTLMREASAQSGVRAISVVPVENI